MRLNSDHGEKSKAERIFESEDFADELSLEAVERKKEIEKAHKIAMSTSSVREDKIHEIKKRISKEDYKVDTSKVVEGIFKEAIMNKLSGKE